MFVLFHHVEKGVLILSWKLSISLCRTVAFNESHFVISLLSIFIMWHKQVNSQFSDGDRLTNVGYTGMCHWLFFTSKNPEQALNLEVFLQNKPWFFKVYSRTRSVFWESGLEVEHQKCQLPSWKVKSPVPNFLACLLAKDIICLSQPVSLNHIATNFDQPVSHFFQLGTWAEWFLEFCQRREIFSRPVLCLLVLPDRMSKFCL